MKKIITIFTLLLLTVSVFAYHDPTAGKSKKSETPKIFLLEEEPYVNDIPFNFYDEVLLNSIELEDEVYIENGAIPQLGDVFIHEGITFSVQSINIDHEYGLEHNHRRVVITLQSL